VDVLVEVVPVVVFAVVVVPGLRDVPVVDVRADVVVVVRVMEVLVPVLVVDSVGIGMETTLVAVSVVVSVSVSVSVVVGRGSSEGIMGVAPMESEVVVSSWAATKEKRAAATKRRALETSILDVGREGVKRAFAACTLAARPGLYRKEGSAHRVIFNQRFRGSVCPGGKRAQLHRVA